MGTKVHEKIVRNILKSVRSNHVIRQVNIVSLEELYRFPMSYEELGKILFLKDIFFRSWYERSPFIKIISLLPVLFQIAILSIGSKYFLFFVDTGILERSAIGLLNCMGCKTLVLQDAMKRYSKIEDKKSITHFGRAKAGRYLLTGVKYLSMVPPGSGIVVGSPIYECVAKTSPLGRKILIVNQCFAHYREISFYEEYRFIAKVARKAAVFGPVEIRLHPHNDFIRYQQLGSELIEISQEKPLLQSLNEAAIVLAVNSTVILEALALGRPVVILRWHPSPFTLPIKEGVNYCDSIDEMSSLLNDWMGRRREAIIPSMALVQKEIDSHIAFSGEASIREICNGISEYMQLR